MLNHDLDNVGQIKSCLVPELMKIVCETSLKSNAADIMACLIFGLQLLAESV